MTFNLSIQIDGWWLVILIYFIARLVHRVRKAENRLDAIESPKYRNPNWLKWIWGYL